MALALCLPVFVGGRRFQRLQPSPTLKSLGPFHQRQHKSRVSLRGPPCTHGVLGTPHREVRDMDNHCISYQKDQWMSKKIANSWDWTLCRTTLLGDVAILSGIAHDQCVHGQYVFEEFWDTNASERQAIAVAWYLATYEGGFDPQTWLWQCSSNAANKIIPRGIVPSNEHHPNLVINIYRWRKLVMQDKGGVH